MVVEANVCSAVTSSRVMACAAAGGVSTIGATMLRVPVSKGQGNARGSREGRLPVGKHPLRLSV